MANAGTKGLGGAATGAAAGSAAGPWGALLGGVLGGVGGFMQGDDQDPNAELIKYLNSLPVPKKEELMLNPEMQQYLGDFTPEMMESLNLGPSAYENIQVDPRLRQNQMSALDKISGLANEGLSEEDRAVFEVAKRNADNQARQQQQAVLQQRQMRGIGGGGDELLASLTGNEAAANRAADAGLQQSIAQAQGRRNAISQLANQSGQLRSQDYAEQERLAQARDLVNQYNTKNTQAVNAANTATQNQASAANLGNRQNIENQNTGIRNSTRQYNAQLPMQIYQAKRGNAVDLGNAYAGNVLNNQQNNAALISGIGQAGSGLAKYYGSSRKRKAGDIDENGITQVNDEE